MHVCMEVQQSAFYAAYIRRLGWVVERVGSVYIYIKPLPLIGALAKIQRPAKLPAVTSLLPIFTKYRIRRLAAEPDAAVSQRTFSSWIADAGNHVRINTDYFLPTKTVRIDTTGNTETIFRRFSEAKRRGVRRAQKHGVTVQNPGDIRTFLDVKAKSAGFLGFITTHGQDLLFEEAGNTHATVLTAHNKKRIAIAGILMLFYKNIAYYWVAGATKEGKHLFAPTLLVWEAVQEANRRGCSSLDFVGVWDERMPDNNTEWKGFTKFKEGFGGNEVYYPVVV